MSQFLLNHSNKNKLNKNVSKYAFSLKHLETTIKRHKEKENRTTGVMNTSTKKEIKSNLGKPMNYEILKAKRKNYKNRVFSVPHAKCIL